MAEDTTIIPEEEILNWEDTKTYTLEEVEAIKKKMQSDSEKWVQKVISEKKLYETAFKESKKIVDNPSYLVDLYDDKPEVAQAILDNFYDWQSIDKYKQSIDYQEDLSDPVKVDKLVDKRVQKLEESRLIEKSKKDFISKLKMTPEETEQFEEAFEERKQLKSFSIDNLEKNLEKAFREISDNPEQIKAMKDQETIAKTIATWEGKGWDNWGKKQNNDIVDFLISRWIVD